MLTFIDITERRQEEEALRELQEEQASDLAATLKLQELSSRLLSAVELPPLLTQLLDATIEMQRAEFGLRAVVQPGIAQRWTWLPSAALIRRIWNASITLGLDQVGASGRSISKRGRIVVTDVNEDKSYAPLRTFAAEAGSGAIGF